MIPVLLVHVVQQVIVAVRVLLFVVRGDGGPEDVAARVSEAVEPPAAGPDRASKAPKVRGWGYEKAPAEAVPARDRRASRLRSRALKPLRQDRLV